MIHVLLLRESFPGENPQTIRCPTCGGPGETTPDGIVWICLADARHLGYYEQPAGVVVPEEKWRL